MIDDRIDAAGPPGGPGSATVTRVGRSDEGRRMRLAEFRDAEVEDGAVYELSRGEIEVSEVPGDPHFQAVDNLREVISAYRRDHPGLILRHGAGSEIRLCIEEFESERHPDLGIVFIGTPSDSRGRRQPSLVVEVVSPGLRSRDRDYREKREEYWSFGILEYWIVDPKLRQVVVLSREGGPSWSEATFGGERAIESRLLPGFAGTVAGLWVDVEIEPEDVDGPRG